MNVKRGAVRFLSPNGDPLREALYSNQKAVALETGAVTTAITPPEQRWPRSISILRCLEESQMTVTVEDSQSVVMKKHTPELERLQLRKKKERERCGGGRRRQSVTSEAQSKNCTAERLWVSLSALPPLLPYCAPTTRQHYAQGREYKAE